MWVSHLVGLVGWAPLPEGAEGQSGAERGFSCLADISVHARHIPRHKRGLGTVDRQTEGPHPGESAGVAAASPGSVELSYGGDFDIPALQLGGDFCMFLHMISTGTSYTFSDLGYLVPDAGSWDVLVFPVPIATLGTRLKNPGSSFAACCWPWLAADGEKAKLQPTRSGPRRLRPRCWKLSSWRLSTKCRPKWWNPRAESPLFFSTLVGLPRPAADPRQNEAVVSWPASGPINLALHAPHLGEEGVTRPETTPPLCA